MVVALALESLAETVTAADPEGGARLLGAATGVLRTYGLVLDEPDQAHYDLLRAVEDTLGRQRTRQLMGSVEDLSLDQAIQIGRTIT